MYRDNNTTLRINTLRVSLHAVILTKGNMNETALIRGHGRKGNGTTLRNSSGSRRLSHGNNLVMSTALIALNIYDYRITEAKLAAHEQRNHGLKSIERTTVTTDQDSKVRRGHIENEFALIALVLIDRRVGSVEVGQNRANNRNSNVSNRIKIGIGQLLTSLIARRNLRVVTSDLRSSITLSLDLSLFYQFISHDVLHS